MYYDHKVNGNIQSNLAFINRYKVHENNTRKIGQVSIDNINTSKKWY